MPNKMQLGGEFLKVFPYDADGQSLAVGMSLADSLVASEFGEVRTAPPGNRSDTEFLYNKQPLLFDDISAGGGSAVHGANGRHVALSVNGTAGTAVGGLRQHYWTPYTPGSGQEIDITGTLDLTGLGGGSASAFLRSTVTGTTVLTEVKQTDWEALTDSVHWQYSQIFRISFQSLRVGSIQFSIANGRAPTKVAEIENENRRSGGYWQYANLPPYWKIYNTATETIAEIGYGDEFNGVGFMYRYGSVQATATMLAICETVKSQGGQPLFDMPGFTFSTPPLAAKTVSTTLIPILSIRVAATLNSIANRIVTIPTSYELLTDNPIDYVILYRAALTNASWVAVNATYSGVEYDITASAVTGGIQVDGGMLASGNNQRIGRDAVLGRTIMSLGNTGTSDILTLAAIRSGSTNGAVKSVLKWKEIQ